MDYSEYDRNGILVTAGNAARAVYYTQREDAEVAGAISLRSQSQGVWLDAETLRWEDASHRLFSGPEETVALTRDDGSQVTGVGLQVDVRRKTIRFSGRGSGTLVAVRRDTVHLPGAPRLPRRKGAAPPPRRLPGGTPPIGALEQVSGPLPPLPLAT